MMNSDEVIDFFKNMSVCNKYREDKEVSREDIKTILEAARHSSSSFGLEPWQFLVVENKLIKEQLFKFCWGRSKESFSGSYLVIVLSRNFKSLKYNSDYVKYIFKDIKKIKDEDINVVVDRYKIFLEDEYNMLENKDAVDDWAKKQSYLAVANIMVASEFLGISSCPIEGFNRDALEEYLVAEGILDKEKFNVSCLMSFGYKREDQLREKKRRPFKELVEFI